MANTYLTRTFGSAGNRKTWTWSAWIKRSGSAEHNIFQGGNSSYNDSYIRITSDGNLKMLIVNGSSAVGNLTTSQVLRDNSGWYNIVCVYDSSNATSGERMRMFINGNRITNFSTETYVSQNQDSFNINNASPHYIGAKYSGSSYFDGLMSHVHFIDSTAYDASYFGSTDSVTGEWKINVSPSVTYGTNGFFILKDGNSVTDQSGNSNNFTVGGGTLTKTEDCPSNVFATLNPLNKEISGGTLSNGNTKLVTVNGSPYTGRTIATLGASSGKYYWEVKPTTTVSSTYPVCSIVGEDFNVHDSGGYLSGDTTNSKSYITIKMADGGIVTNFTGTRVQTSYGNAVSTNDIVGVALDLDNGKVFFSINGTWQNSGDPVNGTNPASSSVGSLGGDIVFPAFGDENYVSSATLLTNFGNGFFGTTAITSNSGNGYAGADGKSKFFYQPPTGYSALSTLGLNQ